MDFLAESLQEIAGISIHWSSDCNMACKYCYIEKDKQCMASYNRDIRAALEDGSFAKIVIEKMASRKDHIENIALWGAEPTINYQYFKTFIYELLDFFNNTNTIMFSTNALLGADCIYDNFYLPLKEYADKNKRHMTFELQLSLDGPAEFNDDSRHPGATATTLQTMFHMIEKFPYDSENLTLTITTKSTMDTSYMKIMNERGIDAFNWYYQFFSDLQLKCNGMAKGKKNLNPCIAGTPTLVDPGFHTVEDGKIFAEWLAHLKYVDRSKIPAYDGAPLFYQVGTTTVDMLTCKNIISESFNRWSCSSGKNNVTIDKDGNIYACNRLCRNAAMGYDAMHISAMRSNTNIDTSDKNYLKKTWALQAFHSQIVSRMYMADAILIPMADAGQIDKKYLTNQDARKLLYMGMCGVMCHVGVEEDHTKNPFIIPTSYAKLLGNGAMEELIQYLMLEEKRGNFHKWQSNVM